MTNILLRYKAA